MTTGRINQVSTVCRRRLATTACMQRSQPATSVYDRPHEQRHRLTTTVSIPIDNICGGGRPTTAKPPSKPPTNRLYTDRLSRSLCGFEILRTRRTVVPTSSLITLNRHLVSGRSETAQRRLLSTLGSMRHLPTPYRTSIARTHTSSRPGEGFLSSSERNIAIRDPSHRFQQTLFSRLSLTLIVPAVGKGNRRIE